jgi:hypothetical protein
VVVVALAVPVVAVAQRQEPQADRAAAQPMDHGKMVEVAAVPAWLTAYLVLVVPVVLAAVRCLFAQ